MANLSGILTTDTVATNDYVGEWQRGVLVRNAKGFDKGSTLFGLMSKLNVENAQAVKYEWFERDPSRLNFYSNAAATSTATTLTFTSIDLSTDATQLLHDGVILQNNRSAEQIIIVGDPTSPNAVVTRGILGTTAAAVSSGDVWSFITSASAEGTGSVRDAYEEPTDYFNYIQTIKETVYVSNAFKGTELRTDAMGPLPEREAYAMERITKKIELAFFFGSRGVLNNNRYLTGGIKWQIDQAAAANSALSANILAGLGTSGCPIASFKTWLQSFMTQGSNEKVIFCGPNSYAALSNYANTSTGGFRIANQETVYGMNVTDIVTPYGVCSLVFHPLFKEMIQHNSTMVAVDLMMISQKSMEPLVLLENQQSPDEDSYKEQFRAKLGIKLKFPACYGYATNLQSIV